MPYAVLERKIRTLPEEYYQLVIDYIDEIMATKAENKTSAFGIAAKFANPALIGTEKEAMAKTFGEKYENFD